MEFKQWENFKCGDWQSEINNCKRFYSKKLHTL